MIAQRRLQAVVGGRATLRYHYKSVGCSDRNARIVCAEA
jgi:hypothetical protein